MGVMEAFQECCFTPSFSSVENFQILRDILNKESVQRQDILRLFRVIIERSSKIWNNFMEIVLNELH